MTVSLLICVVPKESEPYVMIAADSLETSEDGRSRKEDAKKIFDAGNALMTTSGAVDNEFREEVARVLKEHQTDSLNEKIYNVYHENLRLLDLYDFSMVVGLAQFDEKGNPQMAICGVSRENSGVLDPLTLDKNISFATHFYLGERRTERMEELRVDLDTRINTGDMSEKSVADAAQEFINEAAKIYPVRVNNIMQTKVLYFK